MTPSRARVLLVDDDAPLRLLMRLDLETYGPFDVVGEASDGDEALRLVKSLQPDLVLLDVAMPRRGGLESISPILKASPDTAIIMFSMYLTPQLEARANASGALGCIEKSLPPPMVAYRIASLLGIPPIAIPLVRDRDVKRP